MFGSTAEATESPIAVYDHPLVVTSIDIDELGHVNNLSYLRWAVDAALAHSAANGWSTARHLALGTGWVVRSHTIEYLRQVFEGERVLVRTWIRSRSVVQCQRRFEIRRPSDDAIVAKGQTAYAYIEYASGRPVRVPPEVETRFVVVGDGAA